MGKLTVPQPIILPVRNADPSVVSGSAQFYSKTVGGKAQPFMLDDSGTATQIGGMTGVETAGPGLFGTAMSATPTQANTGLTSWAHQPASAAVTNGTQGLVVTCPSQSSTVNLALLTCAAPPTPYTITALVSSRPVSGTGLIFGWSDGTKVESFLFEPESTSLYVESFPNVTSLGSNVATATVHPTLMWLQIEDDGTNVTFSYSTTGDTNTWVTLYTVAKASGYLGATGYSNIVFGTDAFSNAMSAQILSWSVNGGNARVGSGLGLFAPVLSSTPTQAGTGLTAWASQPASATVKDGPLGLTVYCPSQSNVLNLGLVYRTVPATPYTIKALISVNSFGTGAVFGWADGTTTAAHAHLMHYAPNSAMTVYTVASLTGATASYNLNQANPFWGPQFWAKLIDDGTNISFYASPNGDDNTWRQLYTTPKSAGYLGAGGYSNLVFGTDASNNDVYATLASWAQS